MISVPGGTAAYPSSLLMSAVPARLAGVGTFVVASPAGDGGALSPALLGAAGLGWNSEGPDGADRAELAAFCEEVYLHQTRVGARRFADLPEALADGVHSDRVVFVSLHADSRHPSLDGVMVYVPGAAYRTKTYARTGAAYRRYDEVREKPQVRFSKKQRIRSEAVSRKLAEEIGQKQWKKMPDGTYRAL